MEAVPKLTMISFELKVSPEVTHYGPKLKQYIAEAYRENPDNYANEMHQLESLRSTAVRPTSDASGLTALNKYFCQLRAMQSRFPMAKGQPASVNFAWKDLYANMICTSADIRFEMACVLYNIGALHSILGASEPRTSADSLKAACTHFQQAAWAFQHLKDHYPQPPGVDVSPEITRLLQEVCFAQAQECILDKSIQDTKKSSVIGAVATQVMLFYKNSLAILGTSMGTDNIHETIGTKLYNYWYRYLSFKMSYIGCLVALYQGMNSEEQQKMGERVAFYQLAIDKLGEARKLAKYIEPVQVTQEVLVFTNDVVEGKRKAAKNENEFIYHEEVPDKDLLIDLKPVCLVKAIPINFDDPEVSGPDIFAKLIPMGAHEAASMYSEEKAKLLRKVVSQVEVKNTEIIEFMSSLQLDQLDIVNSEQRIPQEIVDRCAAMNAKVDIIQMLVDSMNNLAEIISDVEHSLTECKALIQEEMAKEKEYQKVIGPRPPSIVQTELSREFNKYQEAHTRTNESNQVLHKAMTLHIANLKLLAQPLEKLQAKIPCVENIEGLDRATMAEMRRVVGKAREMQAQREMLLQELRSELNADDITGVLLARNTHSADEVFAQEIQKHTPKVKIIEQNLSAQENIINKLTTLYAAYADSRRMLTDVLRKRDGLINALITSYDTYEELLGKSQKGQEFYKKLSHNVTQLLARLRSTCQVQDEERAQLLAKQGGKATPKPSAQPSITKPAETSSTPVIPSSEGYTPKLKDYLPYMKNRGYARSSTPQAQPEALPPETYYPESIYPTSVRPAPVGSEATSDGSQMKYTDGYAMPAQNPNTYNPYANHYGVNENNAYAAPNKNNLAYEQPKPNEIETYGYNTSYTPPQFSTPVANTQMYNPYYTATQDTTTAVTDSQAPYQQQNPNQTNTNINMNQYSGYNDPYAVPNSAMPLNQVPNVPEPAKSFSQAELTQNFNNMQIGAPKPDNSYPADYSQTYYSVQYPHVSTPNFATYSTPPPSSATSVAPSQVPSDYNSLNYPYSSGADQTVPSTNYVPTSDMNVPSSYSAENPYSYPSTSAFDASGQAYAIYTNADNTTMFSTTSITSTNIPVVADPYSIPESEKMKVAALSHLDTIDKPIKSHAKGEALSTNYYTPKTYDQPTNYNQSEQNVPPNFYGDQANVNYAQVYQNHPGYTYNATSGNYDYSYGSQATFIPQNADAQSSDRNGPNVSAQGIYTSAGGCETVQSPSETPQVVPQGSDPNQIYYNSPYGYQTATSTTDSVPQTPPDYTSYGANLNQSTYMQSNQIHNTNVTYAGNQVSTPVENVPQAPSFNQNVKPENQNVSQNYENVVSNYGGVPTSYPSTESNQNINNYQTPNDSYQNPTTGYLNNSNIPQNVTSGEQMETENKVAEKPEMKSAPAEKEEVPQSKTEPSAFDLLSDIDFTVEQKPLMPEIKVPQVSENAIKKHVIMPKIEAATKYVEKVEAVIERPAKRDVFSDPSLLNKFTEEVKGLQKLVDSLPNTTVGGLTLLDFKWKTLEDAQANEHMTRTKAIALKRSSGRAAQVIPFDDSRVTLKSDPDAYINASYYKQLAPWCIPLAISKCPSTGEREVFWKAVLDNKIGCIVCLLSEIEMQGNSYWPTAKGQSLNFQDLKVSLEEVNCTVHWTERKINVGCGKNVLKVNHYQINVFSAKIVCSPLVLLVDKMLSLTYSNRLSNQLLPALIHCSTGAGRSAVLASLIMVMCQVRAGQINLCEMMDAGFLNLIKHRTNILEDTKFLADSYRTALFYVQGVLCSGTTSFNGETVSVQSGASVLPPVTPSVPSTKDNSSKPNKFSRESFEEMKQSPGLKSGDMKDPLNFLDPLWSLKKK